MTTDPLQNAQKRAFRYWYVDGTMDFSLGGICLVLAAYFYILHLSSGTWLAKFLPVAFVFIFIGAFFLANRLVMAFKERVTFPRTGYISLARKPDISRKRRILYAILAGTIAAAISISLVFFASENSIGFDWVSLFTGLVYGYVLAYLGFRLGVQRFFISAAVSLVVGTAFGFADIPESFGLFGFYSLLGFALLLLGGFALWQYLRENPERTGEEG
jgi:hypothetical protein